MQLTRMSLRVGRGARLGLVGAVAASLAISLASASAAVAKNKSGHLKIAYLSFAVNNTYDAPMLAAAQAEAKKLNASLKVFDANNSPTTQYSQFQNVIAQGGYDGVLTQPIEATNLIPLVGQAVKKGIAVVNMDQTMGPSNTTAADQVKGLSGNVTFVPYSLGKLWGALAAQACQAKHLNPCNIGYLYDIKASSLDESIHSGFLKGLSVDKNAKVVAEGQDEFTISVGEQAVQTMVQGNPSINLIAGSDQGVEGAADASSAAKDVLVGYGASKAGIAGVKSGRWYGTVAQDPATEGKDAVLTLVNAIRTGQKYAGENPLDTWPDNGVVTKSNVKLFTGEWAG